MAPTISHVLGFYEREETPSILSYAEDVDLDFNDDWSDRRSRLVSRNSCPDKKTMGSASWGSRLTLISTTVIDAGTALTTRAKQLGVGESTQWAMSQLRKSMVEVSTRTERSLRAAMPAQHRFSETDIDRFDDDAQPEDEEEGVFFCGHMEPEKEDEKLQKLQDSRLYIEKGSAPSKHLRS